MLGGHELSPTERARCAEAAEGWNDLANEADAFGDYEASRGHYAGVYRHKAELYRGSALTLALEATTGRRHCAPGSCNCASTAPLPHERGAPVFGARKRS